MAKDTPTSPEATEAPERDNVVVLDEPLVRGTSSVTEVTLRKPLSGELRGISLSELINLDVNALRKLLPRITSPALTDAEIGRLDPADLLEIGGKVATFLLKKSAKEQAFLTA